MGTLSSNMRADTPLARHSFDRSSARPSLTSMAVNTPALESSCPSATAGRGRRWASRRYSADFPGTSRPSQHQLQAPARGTYVTRNRHPVSHPRAGAQHGGTAAYSRQGHGDEGHRRAHHIAADDGNPVLFADFQHPPVQVFNVRHPGFPAAGPG